ncbi:histone-lysine N-methyltransferase set-18-like [Eriocheir sinensis]|uniref:histone-lysine N-methyltransferase set-18-like n=1 Tax=Eriocheir sinensis TaxID=95602 RepID=UPI0021C7EFFE|nr:histone-lysine N-methyltransferase set-18-like [Eriocheir sinensis]
MRDYTRVIGSRVLLRPKTLRPVKKGDVILSSMPFAHVINYNYLSMYCDTCAAPLRERLLQPCGGCRVVWYCSEECRRAALVWHRLECFALKRRKHNPPCSFVRLLARIIFRLRDGGDKYEERCCEKGVVRRFRDLMNHYVDLKNTEEMKADIDRNLEDLRNYIGERLLPNESDLLGIYGRAMVNCFSFTDQTMLHIGCAVYLAASIFDHNCSPNCFATFTGLKVEIRSLIDMPDLDFGKCHINYVDPVSTAAARQQDLYKGWFFLCKCQTCDDKEKAFYENSIKCKTPNCNGIVSIPEASDAAGLIERKIEAAREKEKREKKEREEKHRRRRHEEKKMERKHEKKEEIKKKEEEKGREGEKKEISEPRCSECGWTACSETVRQYWGAVAFTKERMKTMDNDNLDIEVCLQILERQKEFSSRNAWRVKANDLTFNAAILNGCWSFALKYGEENQDGMRFYYGVKNPIYYIFLFKLGKTNIYLKELRKGLRILEEAESWLITSLGDSHPIVEELYQLILLANEDREIYLERWHQDSKKPMEKLKVNNEELQQLPFFTSQNESLSRIFDSLNQMYCSQPNKLDGM